MNFKEYIPFYQRNLKIALPVMITQAGQVIVQLADNIMVGHLGAAQLAGVSFANATFMIGFVFLVGFSQGITPIVGQYYGKGDYDNVSKMYTNSMFLTIALSLVLSIIMAVVGMYLGYMGQEAEVVKYAKEYYFINVIAILPSAIFFGKRFYSEGIGNTKNAMWITLGINVINIILNWILIFGKLGAPQMGVAGAALATLISRVLGAAIFILLFFTKSEYLQFIKKIRRPFLEKKNILSILKISLPISFQSLLEVTAFSFAAIMVGWLGKYQLAAHQIAQSLSHLTFMIATGIGSAATIRVSHQFGAGKYKEVKMAGNAAIHMSIAFMGFCGVLFIIFFRQIPGLYTNDVNVIEYAAPIVLIMALYQIFDAIQLASVSSLRALKDINIPLLFSAISYYFVCLPCAYLLGFTFNLGVNGVWIGLLLGLVFASILFYTRFQKKANALVKQL